MFFGTIQKPSIEQPEKLITAFKVLAIVWKEQLPYFYWVKGFNSHLRLFLFLPSSNITLTRLRLFKVQAFSFRINLLGALVIHVTISCNYIGIAAWNISFVRSTAASHFKRKYASQAFVAKLKLAWHSLTLINPGGYSVELKACELYFPSVMFDFQVLRKR